MVEAPASTPAKVLLLGKLATPVTLKTRLAPMLNCAADNVPPTVPLPEMLKFVLDCGLFVF